MLKRTIKRLKHLDILIKNENTGNAEELSKKLGISRKQVYNYIDELKDLGIDLAYDRNIRSFIYKEPYEFSFNLTIKKLSNDEMIDLLGGKMLNKTDGVMKLHKPAIYL